MCVECLFLRTPSRAPYRTPSACAKRAAYPDPPPRSPNPSLPRRPIPRLYCPGPLVSRSPRPRTLKSRDCHSARHGMRDAGFSMCYRYTFTGIYCTESPSRQVPPWPRRGVMPDRGSFLGTTTANAIRCYAFLGCKLRLSVSSFGASAGLGGVSSSGLGRVEGVARVKERECCSLVLNSVTSIR